MLHLRYINGTIWQLHMKNYQGKRLKMITKLKDKFIHFFRWIWKECKDVRTFILLMIVSAVVYSPVWGGYLLSALFGWEWASVMASACLVF